MKIILENIYYVKNKNIHEYLDVFLETNIGLYKIDVSTIELVKEYETGTLNKLNVINEIKKKYGILSIDEIRITYDNDMYILISGKFILAIEYALNSSFAHSIQEFRIIEDIHGINRVELEGFNELEIVEFP